MAVCCARFATFKTSIWIRHIVDPIAIAGLFYVWSYAIAFCNCPRVLSCRNRFFRKNSVWNVSSWIVNTMPLYMIRSTQAIFVNAIPV